MKKSLLTAIAILAVATASCAPVARHHRPHHPQHVKIIHTKNGRWGYHDDGTDIWFWYILTSQNQASYQASVASGTASTSSLPAGGAWVRGAAPTASELEESQTVETELDVDAAGEPAVEASSVEAAEAGQADASADSGATSSGSADAGSASSDGGGGGGDGGGGGGGE